MRTSEKMNQLMKNNNLNPLSAFKYVLIQVSFLNIVNLVSFITTGN